MTEIARIGNRRSKITAIDPAGDESGVFVFGQVEHTLSGHDYCRGGVCITYANDNPATDFRIVGIFDDEGRARRDTLSRERDELLIARNEMSPLGLLVFMMSILIFIIFSITKNPDVFFSFFIVPPLALAAGVADNKHINKKIVKLSDELESTKRAINATYFKASRPLAAALEIFAKNSLTGRNKKVLRDSLQRKILAEQSDDELIGWMQAVTKIFSIDKNHPADLIPVDSDDAAEVARAVLNKYTKAVEEESTLTAETQRLVSEQEQLLKYEQVRELTEQLKDDSAAVKAGALAYLGPDDSE